MNEQRIRHELLEEGLDDWLPVDRLVGLAGELSEQSGEAHRDLTGRLLAQLVGGGLLRVGDLGETGFEAWPGDADAVVRKVLEALDAVAWESAGGVCWLANTPVGDREVSGTGR